MSYHQKATNEKKWNCMCGHSSTPQEWGIEKVTETDVRAICPACGTPYPVVGPLEKLE